MKIAVLVTRTLRGSGFANRILSMLPAYAAAGHEVDVFHYRFPHEEELPSSVVTSLGRYVTMPIENGRYRRHVTLLPPPAWHCTRAHAKSSVGIDGYDLVQAETSSTWSIARRFSATKRIAVFHDDDEQRLRALSKIAPVGVRKVVHRVSSHKYARWQRVVLKEADRVWFVSEIEHDRLVATVPEARTTVIPSGADDELWSVPPLDDRSAPEVLFVAPGFYAPNVSGLSWFMKEVWPLVKPQISGGHVRVVGVGWDGFGSHPDLEFLGWRESLPNEYANARVVIAPLFAGSGVQTKVLEAMAAARPVVTTPHGATQRPPSGGLEVHADRHGFASAVTRYLADAPAALDAGTKNRTAVEELRWSSIWTRACADLDELVGRGE